MDDKKKNETKELSDKNLENVSGGNFLNMVNESQHYANLFNQFVTPLLTNAIGSMGKKNKGIIYDKCKKAKDYATFAHAFTRNRGLDESVLTPEMAEALFTHLTKDQVVGLMLLPDEQVEPTLQKLFQS